MRSCTAGVGSTPPTLTLGNFFSSGWKTKPLPQLFVCLSVGLDHPPLKSRILLLSMFWFGIAASNSVMKKTTRLASVTYNSTSSELHRHKIIKNDDMGVNIRVPRLMRPCRGFFIHNKLSNDRPAVSVSQLAPEL